jgi:hypothetical protein
LQSNSLLQEFCYWRGRYIEVSVYFKAGVLLLQGIFTIKLTTEGLEIKFFIARILLLKGLLYRGYSVPRCPTPKTSAHFPVTLVKVGQKNFQQLN